MRIRSPPRVLLIWVVLMVLEMILMVLGVVLVVLEANIEHRTLFSEQ